MTAPLWLVLLAAAAGRAAAQPVETELRFESRVFNPSHNLGWTDSLNALPGDRIEVRAVVSYTGTSTVYGLGQIIFQPVIFDWSLDDSVVGTPGTPGGIGIGPVGSNSSTPAGYVQDLPGVYGRISPWAGANTTTSNFYRGHIHENPDNSGRTYLRIARADVTNWFGVGASSGAGAANNVNGAGGVTVAQGTIGAGRPTQFPPQNNNLTDLVVFKFGFVIDPNSAPRDLRVHGAVGPFSNTTPPWPGGGSTQSGTRWFSAPDQTAPGLYRTGVERIDGFIHIIPAPAGIVALGLSSMCFRRHRRETHS